MAVQNIPEIRERKVGELIGASLSLLVANFRVLIPLAAWILLPLQIFLAATKVWAGPSIATTLNNWSKAVRAHPKDKVPFPNITGAQIAVAFAGALLVALSTVFLQAVLTAFVGRLAVDGSVDRTLALRLAIRRFPALLPCSIVIGLSRMLSVLPLSVAVVNGFWLTGAVGAMILSLWVMVRLFVAYPPIMLEGVGPVVALRRSIRLTRGMFWKVLGVLALSGAIGGIALIVIKPPVMFILSKLGGSNGGFEFVWAAIAGTVSSSLVATCWEVVAVFLYFDLRVRKEGFDLEHLADELGRRALPKPSAGQY